MENMDMVPAHDFCIHHQISYTFIEGLYSAGIIEVITVEEQPYLPSAQLHHVEKLVRFHTELDINLEGIEAIAHLLDQLTQAQKQLRQLEQRLHLYEPFHHEE